MKGILPTHFASPERADDILLAEQIAAVAINPLIDGLMSLSTGVLAVLNADRQILALNEAFLSSLGITDGEAALGLRPGEALQCVHASDMPGGCGTTEHCQTCGSAVAIVASVDGQDAGELKCALTAERDGKPVELCLAVRARHVDFHDERLILVFLRDITAEERRAALERTFFHDVSNALTSLAAPLDLLHLTTAQDNKGLLEGAIASVARLTNEVAIQRSLLDGDLVKPRLAPRPLDGETIAKDLAASIKGHPAAADKQLDIELSEPPFSLSTDRSLLGRVLTNMVLNALEATDVGGTVRAWADADNGAVRLAVHNTGEIPAPIAKRIFQRHFTTKQGAGRGVGTYSMRLVGEELLGGEISFTTSLQAGTVFEIALPASRLERS